MHATTEELQGASNCVVIFLALRNIDYNVVFQDEHHASNFVALIIIVFFNHVQPQKCSLNCSFCFDFQIAMQNALPCPGMRTHKKIDQSQDSQLSEMPCPARACEYIRRQ